MSQLLFISSIMKKACRKRILKQKWGKPTMRQFSKEQYSKGRNFAEMFPAQSKPQIKPCAVDITELKSRSTLKLILIAASKSKHEQSIKNLVSFMLKTVCLCNFFMMGDDHPVHTNAYQLQKDFKDFYEKNIVMTEEHISLCCDTLG
ncbi:hypothetical protein TSAR_009691 [Trichomalopsis sarcophagae]|uniref:Uncharacterized protein n=1 Tax=Trichomalopsis sarcophagae TaxID=543379 RepID=A0A232EZX5_9HYME|nr:hypothetical protein TSAR_009691 [Trichomalopsis sarcophagae]